MKLTIEPTAELVVWDGVEVRRWRGVTEQGAPCDVYVHRVRVDATLPQEEFQALDERPAPREVAPAKCDVRGLECAEWGFATTFYVQVRTRLLDPAAAPERGWFVQELLTLFWWHRFHTIAWLLEHGAEIPAHLAADQNHPRPKHAPPAPAGESLPEHLL